MNGGSYCRDNPLPGFPNEGHDELLVAKLARARALSDPFSVEEVPFFWKTP